MSSGPVDGMSPELVAGAGDEAGVVGLLYWSAGELVLLWGVLEEPVLVDDGSATAGFSSEREVVCSGEEEVTSEL